MGPLKYGGGKMNYIIGCMDCFSRYLVLFVIENLQYETVIPKFFQHVIYRLGVPKLILTNHASNFTSKKWTEMLDLINSKAITNCPQYHNLNALIERVFKSIQGVMTKIRP